jgi:hypothetical protein
MEQGQKVLDDRGACKEKAVPMVVLAVHYPLPHPVWSYALAGNTDLHRDLRRADVGDNQLLQQLNISSERNARFYPWRLAAEKQKLPAIRRKETRSTATSKRDATFRRRVHENTPILESAASIRLGGEKGWMWQRSTPGVRGAAPGHFSEAGVL